ncbi:MAG TPA: hypothetical protein VGF45_21200, partial [Polyangia bacterium]
MPRAPLTLVHHMALPPAIPAAARRPTPVPAPPMRRRPTPVPAPPPPPLTPAAVAPMTGWGAYPVGSGAEIASEDLERASLRAQLSRGLGRSYGDASLPLAGETVVATPPANRFLAFDEQTGVLRAEA